MDVRASGASIETHIVYLYSHYPARNRMVFFYGV